MKIISIYNNKGGVGKTTTTKRLAISKAEKNKSVLIIDMDPQSNISSQFIQDVNESIYDVLLTDIDINQCIYSTNYNNIDILPSKINLLEANNEIMLKASSKNPATRLKRKIDQLQIEYDYVLIDCPPTMDLLVTNGLTITDDIIIPLSVDNYSLDGINMLLKKINEIKLENNDNLKISGVFLNRVKRSNIHSEMLIVIKDLLSDYVVDVAVGDYAIINENTFTQDESKIKKHKVNEQFEEMFKKMGV